MIIEPKTPHHIETSKLECITVTCPNWYEAQYEEVDEQVLQGLDPYKLFLKDIPASCISLN